MIKLNDFIDDNIITLQNFYTKMQIPTSHVEPPKPRIIPKVVKENALGWLHGHLSLNFKKLSSEIVTGKNSYEDKEVVLKKLETLVDEMPAEKITSTSKDSF